MMWGDRSPRAKLTGDSRRGFEAVLIGDCRSFHSLARNWPLRPLRLLQQYRHFSDLITASRDVRSSEQNRPRRFYERRRNGCHRLFAEWAVMECSHARAEQTSLGSRSGPLGGCRAAIFLTYKIY